MGYECNQVRTLPVSWDISPIVRIFRPSPAPSARACAPLHRPAGGGRAGMGIAGIQAAGRLQAAGRVPHSADRCASSRAS